MDNTQPKQRKRTPLAVVISDIHFNLKTLEVASVVTLQAIAMANELEVPLIVSGDAHDSKANMRGECVNGMIDVFSQCEQKPFLLVGNHSRINEKSREHSINFLAPYGYIINDPTYEPKFDAWFIPYQHDPEEMRRILAQIPDGSRLIIHQGRHGALPGAYSHDKTALSEADYAPFTVLSGHYHQHQTFHNKSHDTTFTYVGNPYTLDFSEAKHPDKGFLVLNEDFTFERVLTYVRKHVVMELYSGILLQQDLKFTTEDDAAPEDILLVKIRGFRSELAHMSKDYVERKLKRAGFRLDLIPTDSEVLTPKVSNESAEKIYEGLVEQHADLTETDKTALKQLWKDYAS